MPKDTLAADATTEKGFGTGLRAQLERRKAALTQVNGDGAEKAAAAAELTVEPKKGSNGAAPVDVETIRAELAASLAREQELRETLDDQLATVEKGLDVERELSERAAEIAKLSTTLTETEHRIADEKRALDDELAALRAERAELEAARSSVTAVTATTAERELELQKELTSVEAKLMELRSKAVSARRARSSSPAGRPARGVRAEGRGAGDGACKARGRAGRAAPGGREGQRGPRR